MATKQRVGVYPGTFDPITLGHLDIILRATKLVDRLVIGVAINRDKGPLFIIYPYDSLLGINDILCFLATSCACL